VIKLLVGILGKLGDGKTLLLTILLYLRHMENYTVYTNYKTTFSDRVATAEELILDLDSEIRDSKIKRVFGLDELGLVLQARNFMSSSNEIMSILFRRSRKLGTDIYYTTQSFQMVDVNVRRITDIIIKVEFNKNLSEVKAQFYEQGVFEYEYSHTMTYEAKEYFDTYDTNEIIEIDKDRIIEKLVDRVANNKSIIRQLNRETKHSVRIHVIKAETQVSIGWCNVILVRLKDRELVV